MGRTNADVFRGFLDRVRELGNLNEARMLLRWDQQVVMPNGGTPARAEQMSTLAAIRHDRLIDPELGEMLDILEQSSLGRDEAAIVREVRREHDRAVAVPSELVMAIERETTEALSAWKAARAHDDYDAFQPTLESLVELTREYAAAIDPDRDPYEVLFEEYEPYLGIDTAERVLEELRDPLVSLLGDIRQSDLDGGVELAGPYPADRQEVVVRGVLDLLGYDWERGRLDESPHPFSTGTMFDARVTTRYEADNPFSAVSSAIHEFGHALYTLGLPAEQYATPLGKHRDLTVHESQSRLWENHVGRSRAFWDATLPVLTAEFPDLGAAGAESVYRQVNRVDPENVIRVEADEVSYHLHILLRFEIERELVRGELDAGEVPGVWNDRSDEYLGVRPASDAVGCLQDIHWSQGSFGYFPTYTLGSVLAAQLFARAERELPGLSASIREGSLAGLRGWLRETIHQHGCRYPTDELIARATGDRLAADPFVDYVTEKYAGLYGV